MIIAIACDHRGFLIKQNIVAQIRDQGHTCTDFGTDSAKPCDYPDFGLPACQAVSQGQAERAILVDGSGIGMSIIANKLPRIRAAVCHDELTAQISRQHNDANVLCLAADYLGAELIRRIINVWLATGFESGRHTRRLEKINDFERKLFPGLAGDPILRDEV
jgi:ribose 5-phosphate isomerase B